jgi:hypothetical protein
MRRLVDFRYRSSIRFDPDASPLEPQPDGPLADGPARGGSEKVPPVSVVSARVVKSSTFLSLICVSLARSAGARSYFRMQRLASFTLYPCANALKTSTCSNLPKP